MKDERRNDLLGHVVGLVIGNVLGSTLQHRGDCWHSRRISRASSINTVL